MTQPVDSQTQKQTDCTAVRGPFLDNIEINRRICKEIARVDRFGGQFCVAVLRIQPGTLEQRNEQLSELLRICAKRLRIIDEIGVDVAGDIVLLLPNTNGVGAQFLIETIESLTSSNRLGFSHAVFVYPEIQGTSSVQDLDLDLSNTGTQSLSRYTAISPSSPMGRPEFDVAGLSIQEESELNTLGVSHFPVWKRTMDVVLAFIGIIIVSPVLLLCAIAIKLTSRGPVLFMQWRTGQHGRPFRIAKLRTMVYDAEELKARLRKLNERDGPAFKIKDDPRVTAVGKFLRATGLDELPQLWNVLVGQMSIVGPRPLPIDEDAQCLNWQRKRLTTKPGITCLWQISKSRQISFDDWMRMDLHYVAKRSFKYDCWLILRTCVAVFLGRVGH